MKEIYKDKFDKLKAPINDDKLWDQISTHPEFPKKPGNGRFLYFIPVVLLVAMGSWFFFQNNSILIVPNEKGTATTTNTNEINSTPQSVNSELIQTSNDEENIIAKVDNQLATKPDHPSTEKPIEKSATNNTTTSNISYEKSTTEKITSPTISKQQSLNYTTTSNDDSSLIRRNNSVSVAPDNSDIGVNQSINNLGSSIANVASTDLTSKNNSTQPNPTMEKRVENPRSTIPINTSISNALSQGKENRSMVILEFLNLKDQRLSWDNRILDLNTPYTDPLVKKTDEIHWKLGIAYALGKANHNMVHLATDLGEQHRTATRLEHITDLETHAYSLSLFRYLPKSFMIGIEAELENIYQRYDFRNSATSIIRNDDITEGFYAYETINTDYKLYHKYRFINISLLAQKQIQLNKFDLVLGGGISYNTSLQVEGMYVDADLNEYLIQNLNQYEQRVNLAYLADIGLLYQLSDHWSLQSIFRLSSEKTLSNDTRDLTHSVRAWNIRTGINYSF